MNRSSLSGTLPKNPLSFEKIQRDIIKIFPHLYNCLDAFALSKREISKKALGDIEEVFLKKNIHLRFYFNPDQDSEFINEFFEALIREMGSADQFNLIAKKEFNVSYQIKFFDGTDVLLSSTIINKPLLNQIGKIPPAICIFACDTVNNSEQVKRLFKSQVSPICLILKMPDEKINEEIKTINYPLIFVQEISRIDLINLASLNNYQTLISLLQYHSTLKSLSFLCREEFYENEIKNLQNEQRVLMLEKKQNNSHPTFAGPGSDSSFSNEIKPFEKKISAVLSSREEFVNDLESQNSWKEIENFVLSIKKLEKKVIRKKKKWCLFASDVNESLLKITDIMKDVLLKDTEKINDQLKELKGHLQSYYSDQKINIALPPLTEYTRTDVEKILSAKIRLNDKLLGEFEIPSIQKLFAKLRSGFYPIIMAVSIVSPIVVGMLEDLGVEVNVFSRISIYNIPPEWWYFLVFFLLLGMTWNYFSLAKEQQKKAQDHLLKSLKTVVNDTVKQWKKMVAEENKNRIEKFTFAIKEMLKKDNLQKKQDASGQQKKIEDREVLVKQQIKEIEKAIKDIGKAKAELDRWLSFIQKQIVKTSGEKGV